MIYVILMSNFDDFDNDQISSKLPQRQHFVYNFYWENIFILGCLDNAENNKWNLSESHPITDPVSSMPQKNQKKSTKVLRIHISKICI